MAGAAVAVVVVAVAVTEWHDTHLEGKQQPDCPAAEQRGCRGGRRSTGRPSFGGDSLSETSYCCFVSDKEKSV
ncbi:unnamed protein product [Camellia sinensis]